MIIKTREENGADIDRANALRVLLGVLSVSDEMGIYLFWEEFSDRECQDGIRGKKTVFAESWV